MMSENEVRAMRLLQTSGKGATDLALALVSRAVPSLLSNGFIEYNECSRWGYSLTPKGRSHV